MFLIIGITIIVFSLVSVVIDKFVAAPAAPAILVRVYNSIQTISQFIQDRTWVVASVVATLFTLHLLGKAFGHREVPWLYVCFWIGFWWAVCFGSLALKYYPQALTPLTFYFARATNFFSQDNFSANCLAVFAIFCWLNFYLQGWPTWGPDPAELGHQAQVLVQKTQKTAAFQHVKSVGDYLVHGGKIPVIEEAMGRKHPLPASKIKPVKELAPLYQRSKFWSLTAILVTLLAVIDFFLSRRDDAARWLGGMAEAILKRRPDLVTSVSSQPETSTAVRPTAPAAEAEAQTQTPAQAGTPVAPRTPFWSDLAAAGVVRALEGLAQFGRKASRYD